MGRLSGRVAIISGGARGQGRSHALAMASEGADIVVFDICEPLRFPRNPPATISDLEETEYQVKALGRRVIATQLDARDSESLSALATRVRAEFGRADILVVNHGIWAVVPNLWETSDDEWQEMIDVNLTSAWKTARAFIPLIIEGGRGGSVTFTSSANGLIPAAQWGHYATAKHGLVGLMRSLAVELGRFRIRVNTVHPGGVDTQMPLGNVDIANEHNPDRHAVSGNLLPVNLMAPSYISNAMVFLASDEAKFITGVALPVDAGMIWATGNLQPPIHDEVAAQTSATT